MMCDRKWLGMSVCLAMGAILAGCAPVPGPVDPNLFDWSVDIAPQVLPGEWEVDGETVVFRFDENGVPYEIYNEADPLDWRTNVNFGNVQHLEAPVGSVDITYEPGRPYISGVTGEAYFESFGTGRNLVVFSAPVPGEGYGRFKFTGIYDAATNTLAGVIEYGVYAAGITLYTDIQDRLLRKRIPATE